MKKQVITQTFELVANTMHRQIGGRKVDKNGKYYVMMKKCECRDHPAFKRAQAQRRKTGSLIKTGCYNTF